MSLFIEPAKTELGLRIEVDAGAYTPDTGLDNIITRLAERDGRCYLEVVVVVGNLFRDAYAVLCAIADRIQIDGMEPAPALHATLGQLAHLLRVPDSFSTEREVGLFGELLTLGGLSAGLGSLAAVHAWRGPNGEEHDFGLPDADIEVKTTTSERRAHWIDSITQLQPTTKRPLWLASHQLTAAGGGFGRTLPEMIAQVGSTLGGAAYEDFVTKLARAGWSDAYSSRVTSRWERRRDSVAFVIDDHFPRLTPVTLQRAGIFVERLTQVRYRVDLEGLINPVTVPAAVAAALGS